MLHRLVRHAVGLVRGVRRDARLVVGHRHLRRRLQVLLLLHAHLEVHLSALPCTILPWEYTKGTRTDFLSSTRMASARAGSEAYLLR